MQNNTQKEPVIIWGGADIDPSLYGEERNGCGYTNKKADEFELNKIEKAVANGDPIIGICRGLQMLTVHQGGKLIQHITPQGATKFITDKETKKKIPVAKAHHQVCVLDDVKEYKIIAESFVTPDNVYIPEIVYFPAINAIGIQGHPEWAGAGEPITPYFFEKIKEHLGIEMKSWR